MSPGVQQDRADPVPSRHVNDDGARNQRLLHDPQCLFRWPAPVPLVPNGTSISSVRALERTSFACSFECSAPNQTCASSMHASVHRHVASREDGGGMTLTAHLRLPRFQRR
jgi:hypothetical protein